MEIKLRKSGIDTLGHIPWGTHFCQFYENREELTDLLVPYFKAGLESNEYCMWVLFEPFTVDDAVAAMKEAVPEIDDYIGKGQMEIRLHKDWYLKGGLQGALDGWVKRFETALARGYEGLRLTFDTSLIERKDWQEVEEYEAAVNDVLGKYRMIALCTYSLGSCTAAEVLNVVKSHRFSLMRDKDEWKSIGDGFMKGDGGAMLSAIVESSDDAIISKAMDGTILSWNQGAERIYGYTSEEALGLPVSMLVPPDLTGELDDMLERLGKGERIPHHETVRIRKDGTPIHVSITLSPMKDPSGMIIGASSIARDITEYIKMEEELRASSQYARSLIEASLDPLVTIGADGRIMDVNAATELVTGYSRQDLIGTDISDYFTEPEKAREGYEQVFAKGFVTDYPLTIRHRDGRLTEVLYNASVYRDALGNVLGVFAAARDVTESNRVMREFLDTKNFLDNILQSSTKYSIIGEDLNHAILSWNEGARLNYGYSGEEIIGRDSAILHVPEDIDSGAVERLLHTAYEKGLAEGEFLRLRKDGSRFMASVVVTRRNDAAGQPLGYLLMSNDITEKKIAEERARYASQYARSLIEASLDPLVTISPEGKITDVNEATELVTGHARQELVGTAFSDYFTEPEKAKEVYELVFREGAVRDYALEIRHRDGRTTPVLYNASVYRDEGGTVIGLFAAAREVAAQKRMMEMLKDQQRAFMEVSVPVVNIWRRIILVPLIGVFDSKRAQLLMETLLSAIEETQAKVAILDISGIPVMDTLVAKHLIRTGAAARLMGTECIITGIRATISQTIVHLGVDLAGIRTKTTLDEGIRLAFGLTKMKVVPE